MFWVYIAFAAYLTLGILLVVGSVGKEKKPTTGGVAAATVLVSGFIVYLLVTAGINTL